MRASDVAVGAVAPPSARGGRLSQWSAEPRSAELEAWELTIRGVVQGVGFRPHVHRIADRTGVTGWVRNEAGAVRVRAEAAGPALEGFASLLRSELPPLARIDAFEVDRVEPVGFHRFEVVASDLTGSGRLPVSPDVSTCAACEGELRDPENARYRYPFITCTDCGPRFTVIEAMPYDRERTTMRGFRQCASCAAEYGSPGDRRYHSETNSCPRCGPRVWLVGPDGPVGDPTPTASDPTVPDSGVSDAPIAVAAAHLAQGKIVAIRGLGGFHLAVRADDDIAVRRLRLRKRRDAKPLAVMVRTLAHARRLALVRDVEAELLESPQRPIVVLRTIPGSGLADSVAPGLESVGVMLAYTPLHHLLLEAAGDVPMVMTSGNVTDEPIAIGNDEAQQSLGSIADVFLLHDREIVARYDDSVVRVAAHGPIMLRRSRGYAPMPLALPVPVDGDLLAVGPHLKNTFTLASGRDAFVSQHVGDLDSLETVRHFEAARARFETLFSLRPTRVVRDLHPGYLSTMLAERSGLEELPPVQHHHAHVAAVMGEHGVVGPVLGIAFDGTGLGSDGQVWGCELLVADLLGFRRVGHLRYAPLAGGDKAARAPWRSLLGYASLDRAEGSDVAAPLPGHWAGRALLGVHPMELRLAARQIERSLNAPLASSMGRLFDAAAALLGLRSEAAYEGQAAMELESAAGSVAGRELPFPFERPSPDPEAPFVLDPVPLLRALALGRAGGRPVARLAADFHESVAGATARLAVELAREAGVATVALGGGCFQNARLCDALSARLEREGQRVLLPRDLGPNDGAVSYGQAVVAAARLASRRTGPAVWAAPA